MHLTAIAVLTTLLLAARSSAQTTWFVDDDACPGPGAGTADDPFCSIQVGIAAASAGDEIVVAPGIYFESIDFLGKPIVVRSVDPLDPAVVGATLVDAPYGLPAATVQIGVLDGLTVQATLATGILVQESATIRRCVVRDCAGFGEGGGMLVSAGAPWIHECTFANNASNRGGGLAVLGGSPTITASRFVGNVGYAGGGGIHVGTSGDVVIEACRFVANGTYDDANGGGAVSIDPASAAPVLIDATGCANVPVWLPAIAGPWIDGGGNAFGETCEDDCNLNAIPDDEDVANGTSADCNANAVPDECDIAIGRSADCNWNGVPDDCDIADGTSADCDGNGVPDDCGLDCNGNGIPDPCDIAEGTSLDCDANGVPDDCQPDCNGNGVADACDVASGASDDCNANGVPDECDGPDCDGNGVLDACDIANGTSPDCNGNGVPDSCDLVDGAAADCDGNGVPDACDIADGALDDCNANGIADLCEEDANGDGIADDCQPARNLTTNAYYATIQEAIDAAQDGDEIMVMPGLYPPPAFPLLTADISGKSITLRSVDPDDPAIVAATILGRIACGSDATSATVIDGFTLTMGAHPIADFALVLFETNATIRRCRTIGANGFGLARVVGGSPTFDRCRFVGNQLAAAAIWGEGANPLLIETVVCGNALGQIAGPWTDGGGNVVESACPSCVFDPAGCCPADLDGNDAVDFADLLGVLSSWGACADCPADLDADGAVGFGDLLLLLSAWGPCV